MMISVIIPVYNVENYIHVCLNSVLKQTYQDFEVICIEDASTDSTPEILEYFVQKDSRIRVLKNESNKGPGFSRNIALKDAKGKYVIFLDGDDWLSLNALETTVEKAEKDDLDLVMFKNIVHYEDSHEFGWEKYYDMEFMDEFENRVFNHWDLDKRKLFSIPNGPCNKLYLKSFLDRNDIRFPDENLIHEDNPFFYKVITTARRISLVNEYLYNRRRRPGSIMTFNDERLFDNIDVMYMVFKVFFEDEELYSYYNNELLHYIFTSVFNGKYAQIEDSLKEEFYSRVQDAYRVYIKEYGLLEDIRNNVNNDVLEFFKVESIAEEID